MRAAVLLALLSLPLFAQLPDGASTEIRVQEVKGEVEYQIAPKTPWSAAQVGDVLPVGTRLCTGVDSGAVLAFGTNSIAMVREASMLTINSFGMQGDRLVAQVMIDPGVCSVSVKQLATFTTDFQVSTPRLTASVRGSGHTTTSNGGPADLPDEVRVDEHFAEIVQQSGASRGVAEGGVTDSNNTAPDDKALGNNIIEVVTGLAESETADPALSLTSSQLLGPASDQTGPGGNPLVNSPAPVIPESEPSILGVAQFTLTWGADPRDLDAHLQGPLVGGGRDEVFFGHRVSNDSLYRLDQDDTDGFGPEVIHIDQLLPSQHYTYYVNLFAGTGSFASSPAMVTYESQSERVEMQATGSGENWVVGRVDVDAQGRATFTAIDTYSSTPPPNE